MEEALGWGIGEKIQQAGKVSFSLVWYMGIFYGGLLLVSYVVLPYVTTKGMGSGKRKVISIFVLGDLGHSPRMAYHARSFAKLEYYVNLCGYMESMPPPEVSEDDNIELCEIEVVRNTENLPFVLYALKKVIKQCFLLTQLLFRFRGSDYIMIQNPPSLPILLLAVIFTRLFSRNTELIIDWHNLNYTILNLKYNNVYHPLVIFLRLYEKYLGRFSDLNITVTSKMKDYLISDMGIEESKIVTLHDRPAEKYVPFEEHEMSKDEVARNHELFSSIKNVDDYKILISSTSFTPDEDFNILLNALKKYDLNQYRNLPPLLVIITGKGPLKEGFLQKVEDMKFSSRIVIRTEWLSNDDYPVILSMADLGISLHTSSSGIDLPMKIVDFFGCGVPVISLNFPAIDELVKNEVNGLLTASDSETVLEKSEDIYQLLSEVFYDDDLLSKLKSGAMSESRIRWDDEWDYVMKDKFDYFEN